ncbi:MAG: group III truncated hemoglobin [Solirubrobacteraceae bacterium]|nr:group III truncated hemoglobin [Solirubrobacteraceae bacterium]
MSDDRHDLATRADCEALVRAFYGRALTDDMIGYLFVDIAKLDLEAHIPEITSFWETILLGARSYSGGAFRPHAALNAKVRLRSGHFERWLTLWRRSVDELFEGPRAELAKSHATRVAGAFHGRLQSLPSAEDPVSGGGGLLVTHHNLFVAPPSGANAGD